MAAPFEEKPIHEWDDVDVTQWLRAGFFGAGGWTKKLSRDYGELFLVCGVTGDSLLDMQCFQREDWLAMADELDAQQVAQGMCAVKLADRAKITLDIVRRAHAAVAASPLPMVSHDSAANSPALAAAPPSLCWSPGQLGGLRAVAAAAPSAASPSHAEAILTPSPSASPSPSPRAHAAEPVPAPARGRAIK